MQQMLWLTTWMPFRTYILLFQMLEMLATESLLELSFEEEAAYLRLLGMMREEPGLEEGASTIKNER